MTTHFNSASTTRFRIYAVKKWDLIKEFSHHSADLVDFAWGMDASYLITGAVERRICLLA